MQRLCAGLVAAALLNNATPPARGEEANCGFRAWLTDTDPAGTYIRDQPSTTSRIVATLKRPAEPYAMGVFVTGYRNGWLRIGLAAPSNGPPVFDGEGWMASRLAAVTTRDFETPPRLYVQPSTASRVAAELPSGVNVTIIGFACGFARVRHQGREGWLRAGHMRQ